MNILEEHFVNSLRTPQHVMSTRVSLCVGEFLFHGKVEDLQKFQYGEEMQAESVAEVHKVKQDGPSATDDFRLVMDKVIDQSPNGLH